MSSHTSGIPPSFVESLAEVHAPRHFYSIQNSLVDSDGTPISQIYWWFPAATRSAEFGGAVMEEPPQSLSSR